MLLLVFFSIAKVQIHFKWEISLIKLTEKMNVHGSMWKQSILITVFVSEIGLIHYSWGFWFGISSGVLILPLEYF